MLLSLDVNEVETKDTHRTPLGHGPLALAGRTRAVLGVRWSGHRVTRPGVLRAADVPGHLGFAATFGGTLDGGGNHRGIRGIPVQDAFKPFVKVPIGRVRSLQEQSDLNRRSIEPSLCTDDSRPRVQQFHRCPPGLLFATNERKWR